MKKAKFIKAFIFLAMVMVSNLAIGQNAYIQVTGEPDLSVYLNNEYKGKTNVEYSGYIIQNVTPGKNLIKIVKDGYTPFEETITVKAGEVFAYKVKPFVKNSVFISQQGNSGHTDKKAEIATGKLIVQSLPIEIKITIPGIEGVKDNPKARDKWIADNISTGNYEVRFSFGQKVITKTVSIQKDKVTSVFVNMLNGEFEEKTDEKLPYDTRKETIAYINKLLSGQGRIYYTSLWCSYCKDKVDNKLIDTYDKIYSPYAFTYSEQSKTYTLTETTSVQTYVKHNGEHSKTTREQTYDFKNITFNGDIVFEEETPCENNAISGLCLTLWVKVKGGKSFWVRLPNRSAIPAFKKAFLHLQELGG